MPPTKLLAQTIDSGLQLKLPPSCPQRAEAIEPTPKHCGVEHHTADSSRPGVESSENVLHGTENVGDVDGTESRRAKSQSASHCACMSPVPGYTSPGIPAHALNSQPSYLQFAHRVKKNADKDKLSLYLILAIHLPRTS